MERKNWNGEKSIYDRGIDLVRNNILTSEEENHLLKLLENHEQMRDYKISFEMLLSAIEENQLKEEEEHEIKKLILENRQKRGFEVKRM